MDPCADPWAFPACQEVAGGHSKLHVKLELRIDYEPISSIN